MIKKRIVCVCMAIAMVATLITGCGKDNSGKDTNGKTAAEIASGKFYTGESREELLYGEYLVNRSNFIASTGDYKSFMDGMTIMDYDNEGTNVRLSALPMEMKAGRYGYLEEGGSIFSVHNFPSDADLEKKRSSLVSEYGEDGVKYFNNYLESLNAPYIKLCYILESDEYVDGKIFTASLEGFYKVSGNKVTIYADEPDAETYELKYEKPATTFEFDFSNNGGIVLTNEGSEVELVAEIHSDSATAISKLFVDCYIADGDKTLNNIASINYIEGFSASLIFEDGNKSYGTELSFDKNGTFTMKWKGTGKGIGSEMVENPVEINGNYLFAYGHGLILTVDNTTYYYTDSERDYFGDTFSEIDTENMTSDQVTEIANAQINIRNELQAAFDAAGISVTIDERTGEVTTDDSILFGVDESEVSDDGKAYLDKFLSVYVTVVQPYIEDGYISKIMVEGHTDTTGSYEYNMTLSEDRAKSVAEYCVEIQPTISNVITSKGFSFENPVLDASGNIDMNASRRVVFSFKMAGGRS